MAIAYWNLMGPATPAGLPVTVQPKAVDGLICVSDQPPKVPELLEQLKEPSGSVPFDAPEFSTDWILTAMEVAELATKKLFEAAE